MRDPHILLSRALVEAGAVIEEGNSTPWASATFTGARHRFTVKMADRPILPCKGRGTATRSGAVEGCEPGAAPGSIPLHDAAHGPPPLAGEDWIAALSDREFDLPGHLVADILVTARDGDRLAIEALTIEDC